MNLGYLRHLADYSDGVLYALALLLLVALAVTLDRFWFLRRTILSGQRVVREIGRQPTLGAAELETLRQRAGALPEAALLAAALSHLDLPAEALSGRLDEAIMLLAPRIDRRMWVLDTIVTLAPLLGLFGTIIGMFHAFSVLAQPGHAPTAVTAGVADALVATASGIFIAMLGLAAFNALSDRVRIVLLQLDTVKTMVLNRLAAPDRRGAGSLAAEPKPLRAVAAGE
ncbi:MAG TPA: MotA/TolQ/ExbB proton channel family protein [Acetobacteraceae bacterium]|nr:MotA/TolQ/ExbB proton channel family protein [Acetobacteraceae bacterium]